MRRAAKLVFDKARGIYEPAIREEDIVIEIMQRLAWNKIKVYRIAERIPGMSRRLSTPGIPDLVGWVQRDRDFFDHPLPLFIEVKRPGGVRRVAQIQFIDEAKSDGCVAFFAESYYDVVREMKAFGVTLK